MSLSRYYSMFHDFIQYYVTDKKVVGQKSRNR